MGFGGYGWSWGNEWLLVVTSGYGWLWVGNGWLPMATMVTGGYEWIWVFMCGFGVVTGCYGVVTDGYRWLRVVFGGYGWL